MKSRILAHWSLPNAGVRRARLSSVVSGLMWSSPSTSTGPDPSTTSLGETTVEVTSEPDPTTTDACPAGTVGCPCLALDACQGLLVCVDGVCTEASGTSTRWGTSRSLVTFCGTGTRTSTGTGRTTSTGAGTSTTSTVFASGWR